MGRRAAHRESALQAAVLLAVLALSAAAPRTAVRNRLEEAGGATGRTIADWTTWTDVPKEALTIFDNGMGAVRGARDGRRTDAGSLIRIRDASCSQSVD